MRVSIIIPALNEAAHLGPLIAYLYRHADERLQEIIVVDGKSTDETLAVAEKAGAQVFRSAQPCRATQMNEGAQRAMGEVLYFVHADVLPPPDYLDHIAQAVAEGHKLGCFRFVFNSPSRLLALNAFFTRFDRIWCRGGDQTLFVTRTLFNHLGGFDERYVIMEEYDFILRARKAATFKIMPADTVVSSRKYEHNSYLRVTLANLTVFVLFLFGVAPRTIQRVYHRLLRHPKAIQ